MTGRPSRKLTAPCLLADQIKDVIQGLYNVMVQTSQYDSAGGRPSREVIASEL